MAWLKVSFGSLRGGWVAAKFLALRIPYVKLGSDSRIQTDESPIKKNIQG